MNDDPFIIGGICGVLLSVFVSICCWNARNERIERRQANEYRLNVIENFRIDLENFQKNKEEALQVPQ